VVGGLFDVLLPEEVAAAERAVRRAVSERLPVICAKIEAGDSLDDSAREALLRVAREAMETMVEDNGGATCRPPTS
jgi:hypothetical protein